MEEVGEEGRLRVTEFKDQISCQLLWPVTQDSRPKTLYYSSLQETPVYQKHQLKKLWLSADSARSMLRLRGTTLDDRPNDHKVSCTGSTNELEVVATEPRMDTRGCPGGLTRLLRSPCPEKFSMASTLKDRKPPGQLHRFLFHNRSKSFFQAYEV